MILKYKEKGLEFINVDEGIAMGVLVDVEDHGDVEVTYDGETKFQHKLRLVFEVPAQRVDDGSRPKTIGTKVTASIAPSAKLRKYAEALMGRTIEGQEAARFDTESLVGQTAKLLVIHREIEGKTWHCIESVQPSDEELSISGEFVRQKDRETQTDRPKKQDGNDW